MSSPSRRCRVAGDGLRRNLKGRVLATLLALCGNLFVAAPVLSDPLSDVAALAPLWRQAAPLCQSFASSENCEDGDMTLFNGLLCAAGEALGCKGVQDAQDSTGRWRRSPRLAVHPPPGEHDSFSWDMVLGVQLYVATTGDKAALDRWLKWVEQARPCLTESPNIGGKTYCLIRGWPRWCPDDTEKGCTARPQDLAALARTLKALGMTPPPPGEDTPPSGLEGLILKQMQDAARPHNAELSLERLLPGFSSLSPSILVLDAALNRPGYSRHLAGVGVLLERQLKVRSPEGDLAATIISEAEPKNAFFGYLAKGRSPAVAQLVLDVAPGNVGNLPIHRSDWAWQRTDSDEAWRRSNLWDHFFMATVLGGGVSPSTLP